MASIPRDRIEDKSVIEEQINNAVNPNEPRPAIPTAVPNNPTTN